MSKILNYIKKIFNQDVFEEGYVYIIFDNTEYTENPDKYSEGVFAWYEDGTLLISLQFQINNGGDPLVFKKYLLKEKEISEVI
ncbi:hypothetical protein N8149_00200 [Gammaproteobacteria bacterium]|nr:hypothetical protein [Gammaproteobacteria bacterium]